MRRHAAAQGRHYQLHFQIMGIDIYARYRGQPQEVITRHIREFFSDSAASDGHLHEAYDGEPYITRLFVGEAFRTGAAEIPAAILRHRLATAVRLARQREREIYGTTDRKKIRAAGDRYVNFFKYCEAVEKLTGKPATTIASF
jgi:hypothetical protein